MEKDIVQQNKEKEAQMAEENRQLFLSLGITQEDLAEFLQDPKKFSPEVWAFLQKKREELERQIDEKIRSMNSSTKKEAANPKGHWLFVK
jgi:DNA-binding transcriptional MerR regulator